MMSSPAPLDATPASAASAEQPPPPEDGWRSDLPALRAELDRIDDALHDLLMQRARVVEQVGRSGKRAAYRPGREASIIRRLLRRHSGALPPQTLVRLWRELLAGTTAMQGAFTVAVCEPDADAAFTQTAREHFGALTPLHACGSPAQVISAVGRGAATVGVLPMPTERDRDIWWTALLQHGPRMHIVARLPFWAPRPDGAPAAQALVIAADAPDPSEHDRSLLGLELVPDVSDARLAAALTAADLTPDGLRSRIERPARALVEVAGHLTDDDVRLARLDCVVRRPTVLGAYAIPETGAAA